MEALGIIIVVFGVGLSIVEAVLGVAAGNTLSFLAVFNNLILRAGVGFALIFFSRALRHLGAISAKLDRRPEYRPSRPQAGHWACPDCGSNNDASTYTCVNCGQRFS